MSLWWLAFLTFDVVEQHILETSSDLETVPVCTGGQSDTASWTTSSERQWGWGFNNATDSVQENHRLNCDKMSKGYLYVSESCCQIGVLQHTRAEECDRQDAELTKQALVHGFRWDTERQPVSKDKVSSLTPASFLYTLWRPIYQRREYPLYGNNTPVYALVFSTCFLLY